jgi:hypothetical protein
VINHIIWTTGTFTGGDFEKGVWKGGTFSELSPANPARFGTKADGTSPNFTDRAIWYGGVFSGGEFWSGLNSSGGAPVSSAVHNGSVFYSGQFSGGHFWGGSFIAGVFKNAVFHGGVWFGGYYATSLADVSGSVKQLTIDPAQYDAVLGITGPNLNTVHNMGGYFQTVFQMLGTPTSNNAFTYAAFLNQWDLNSPLPPVLPNYGLTLVSATATTINLVATSSTSVGTTYIAANPSSHVQDGRPFLCAVFENATWAGGVFLNGYFTSSVWQCGSFINGYVWDSEFGMI